MNKKKYWIWVSGLILAPFMVFLNGCDSITNTRPSKTASSDAANVIERDIDYYSRQLRVGMPRQEALAFLPKPQNTNTQNVCVWASPSTETLITQDRHDWQWLQRTRGGYFLVFVDDKLATPLCANAAFDPWQALEHYAHLSNDQIELILGRKP